MATITIPGTDNSSTGKSPSLVGTPTGNRQFALFDSLRAIAALSVLVCHVALAAKQRHVPWVFGELKIGVAIFFLISGFLLYRPFVAARFGHGRPPSVRGYLRRRVMRIVPAYWLALTVLGAAVGLHGVLTGDWWMYYGFLHVYWRSHLVDGLDVSWTLCVEMSFYLILPFFAFMIARTTRGWRRRRAILTELGVLGSLGCLAVVLRGLIFYGGHTSHLYFLNYNLLTNMDWFALGMGLALLSVVLPKDHSLAKLIQRRSTWCWVAALALFGLAVGSDYFRNSESDPLIHVLDGAAACALLLPAVFAEKATALPQRMLRNRVLTWLGVISYGIYLWHLALMQAFYRTGLDTHHNVSGFLMLMTAGILASVAAAAASYYAVERRAATLKFSGPRFGNRRLNPQAELIAEQPGRST